MWSPKGLVLAGALILPHAPIDATEAHKPPEAAHVSNQSAEGTTQPKYTAKDYWLPLHKWLKKQGSPLSGYDFYIVGRRYGIDPDLLIGIAKAETSLALVEQRGSKYNIGSVCSYDSTSTTCATRSYRHGIEQIAQTLKNRQLGHYRKVSQLSRYGNAGGAIYASSPINWHRNVIGTMNALKGKQKNNYPIHKRVGP